MENSATEFRNGKVLVGKLRAEKLRSGLPFMINLQNFSENQCFMEYPDGSIKLVKVVKENKDIEILKVLSTKEAQELRRKLKFSAIN